MGSIDKTTRSCRWLSRVLVTSSRFENISVEEPIARHLNKTNLLIEKRRYMGRAMLKLFPEHDTKETSLSV